MIEGVAGPETANNAYANAALIPLFTLGIPGSPTVAIIMGAFMMNGLDPRPLPVPRPRRDRLGRDRQPLRRQRHPAGPQPAADPALGEAPADPAAVLYAFILGFCVIGAYSINGQVFDVGLMMAFGVSATSSRSSTSRSRRDPDAHPRPADGAVAAAVAGDLAGRLHDLPHPADLADLIVIAAVFTIASTMRIAARVRGADSEV